MSGLPTTPCSVSFLRNATQGLIYQSSEGLAWIGGKHGGGLESSVFLGVPGFDLEMEMEMEMERKGLCLARIFCASPFVRCNAGLGSPRFVSAMGSGSCGHRFFCNLLQLLAQVTSTTGVCPVCRWGPNSRDRRYRLVVPLVVLSEVSGNLPALVRNPIELDRFSLVTPSCHLHFRAPVTV